MARCFGCHLERQLRPVPVQGGPSTEALCSGCSRNVDQSVGMLEALGYQVIHESQLETVLPDSPNGTEPNVKEATKAK